MHLRRLPNEEIGTQAMKHLAWREMVKEGKIPSLALNPRALPPPYEQRIFIGGNYALAPVLRYIQQVVIRKGFMPIFVGDFKIRRSKMYETALTLLRECNAAIFEVTYDSGHLLEIHELAKRKEISLLMLYMALDYKKRNPRGATSMLQSMPFSGQLKHPIGYQSFRELENIISEFLRSVNRQNKKRARESIKRQLTASKRKTSNAKLPEPRKLV